MIFHNTNGALGVIQLFSSGAVPSTARYSNGLAHYATGELYVAPISGAVPATAVYVSGRACTSDGALYVTTQTFQEYNAGIPQRLDGAVCVSAIGATVGGQFVAPFGYVNANTLCIDGPQVLVDGNTLADYQSGNYTGTLNASAWLNSIGAAPSLAQASGAAQPIILPFAGAKYVYLPAVASNTVTTPTKTITGNFTITFDVALNDYTPAADVTLFGKTSGNDGFQVKWLTTDKIRLVIGDGVGLTNVDVVAASSFTDGTRHTATIVWQDGVGATFSYDGVVSGSQVAAVKTLTNAAVSWTLGSTTSIGKVYDHTMTNGGATTYYHLNPAASAETSTNAATWTSDNGEVYTLNNTGALPAQIVGSPSLLLDPASSMFMDTGAITLNLPCSWYLVASQATWAGNTWPLNGRSGAGFGLNKTSVSPKVALTSTGATGLLSNWLISQKSLISGVTNIAGSTSTLNIDGTSTSGDLGVIANPSGIIFGAFNSAGAGPASVQGWELIVRSGVDTAATQAQIQALLKQIHGTP